MGLSVEFGHIRLAGGRPILGHMSLHAVWISLMYRFSS